MPKINCRSDVARLALAVSALVIVAAGANAQTPPAKANSSAVNPKPDPDAEKFAKRAAHLWSLQPVHEPAVPAGVTSSSNPIDAFIAETYKEKNLQPVPKADKLTLLRRVSYDLTGLPPSVEDEQKFLADETPGAYEHLVDRLLASDQHGVRWARHWLDVLRYADQDSGMPAASGNLPVARLDDFRAESGYSV